MNEEHVSEQINNREWYCSSHGILEPELLGVTVNGQLYCEICSAANIGRENDPIDPQVISKDSPDYANNSDAVSLIYLTPLGVRRSIVRSFISKEHDDLVSKPLFISPRHPGVSI